MAFSYRERWFVTGRRVLASLPSCSRNVHRDRLPPLLGLRGSASRRLRLALRCRPAPSIHAANIHCRFGYVQDIVSICPIPIEYRDGIAPSPLLRGRGRRTALRTRRTTPTVGPTLSLPSDPGSGTGDRLRAVRSSSARCPFERRGKGVPGGCPVDPEAGGRGDGPCGARGARPGRDAARRFPGERVLARDR